MEKMNNRNHLLGRIFLGTAILIIMAIPIAMAIILKVKPDFGVTFGSITNMAILIFFLSGVVEVITYSPLLGTRVTWLT